MTTPTREGQPAPETDVGIRNLIFAAPSDDPRARRPADVAVLVVGVTVVAFAAVVHSANNDTDGRVLGFFEGPLPGWVSGTLTIVYLFGGLYTVGLLLGIAIFGRGRGALVRDMLSAAALTVVGAVALSWMAGPEWPDVLPEWLERDGLPSYPVFGLSLMVAVLGVANPYLTVPMRRVGGQLVGAVAIAALVMGYGTLSGTVGGFALGMTAAAVIHLIFGSAVGIPSKARIRAVLTTCGMRTTDVEYLDHQPVGTTLVKAQLADGSHALVKVYGRDAADAAFAARVWRSMWYRNNPHAITATGLQLVEHESLMLLASARAHAPVPALVGWGRGATGDAVVATEWSDAPRLAELDAAQIDDALLDNMWHVARAAAPRGNRAVRHRCSFHVGARRTDHLRGPVRGELPARRYDPRRRPRANPRLDRGPGRKGARDHRGPAQRECRGPDGHAATASEGNPLERARARGPPRAPEVVRPAQRPRVCIGHDGSGTGAAHASQVDERRHDRAHGLCRVRTRHRTGRDRLRHHHR